MARAGDPSLKKECPAAWLSGCRTPLKGVVASTSTETCSPPRRRVSSCRCRQNTYLRGSRRQQHASTANHVWSALSQLHAKGSWEVKSRPGHDLALHDET